ncbi:MAG: hypothetical protein PF487_14780 [Bacteroidales bacterium]|jgi:hypothetical protein|nr:hypothetical protein [Bacteroidales bacterium]
MGSGAKYTHVHLDTHFWTNLEQLLEFFKHQEMSQEYLLSGLKNTKKNGYEIQSIKNVKEEISLYFNDIDFMIKYVKYNYNKDVFTAMLVHTILNGYDLMETKRIFKIDLGNVPEEEIEEYIRNIAIPFKKSINMERKKVYKKIDDERDYQDLRWSLRREKNNTPDEQKSPSEWINNIEYHINMAKIEIYHLNDELSLAELRKVAALAVRCLELYGCPERIMPEDLK